MTEAGHPGPAADPDRTGHAVVDEALDGVGQLEELPVADHHDRLDAAHEQLRQALDAEPGPAAD